MTLGRCASWQTPAYRLRRTLPSQAESLVVKVKIRTPQICMGQAGYVGDGGRTGCHGLPRRYGPFSTAQVHFGLGSLGAGPSPTTAFGLPVR